MAVIKVADTAGVLAYRALQTPHIHTLKTSQAMYVRNTEVQVTNICLYCSTRHKNRH